MLETVTLSKHKHEQCELLALIIFLLDILREQRIHLFPNTTTIDGSAFKQRTPPIRPTNNDHDTTLLKKVPQLQLVGISAEMTMRTDMAGSQIHARDTETPRSVVETWLEHQGTYNDTTLCLYVLASHGSIMAGTK